MVSASVATRPPLGGWQMGSASLYGIHTEFRRVHTCPRPAGRGRIGAETGTMGNGRGAAPSGRMQTIDDP